MPGASGRLVATHHLVELPLEFVKSDGTFITANNTSKGRSRKIKIDGLTVNISSLFMPAILEE